MSKLQILNDVPLAQHSTMRLGGTAAYAVTAATPEQLIEAWHWADERKLPFLVIGDGSNIVWRDQGFSGLLIINRVSGYRMHDEDANGALVTVGAGENWDSAVARSVEAGLSGIEALSLIPGTAGATPVQNVGAYGQDISQTLVSVQAYDSLERTSVSIPGSACGFGYRTSRFKTTDRGRFIISGITMRLTRATIQPPLYRALQEYLDRNAITDHSAASIRQAVIAIRSDKLPDPATVANNGSFFANPVISRADCAALLTEYPDMPHWPTADADKAKIPAAWLVEHAGFKDYHDAATGMGTWPKQALVLVNEHATHTADLLAFRETIVNAVRERFGISLEQEPELLPA